jgi:hypothetical protein
MIEALEARGITSDYLSERLGVLLADDNPKALSAGIGHAMKIGVGGGYKTDAVVPATVNIMLVQNNPVVKSILQNAEEELKRALLTKPAIEE